MASATIFNTDPAAQARHFAEAGFSWLHVVDLDGAFAGKSVNGEAVRAIRRAGHVAVEGWAETSDIGAIALARRFADAGVAAIVYTDIGRDGALTGVDAAAIARFARFAGLPVIASGGVAGIADIAALKTYEREGVSGVICGRALYDGRLDGGDALRLVAEPARGTSAC